VGAGLWSITASSESLERMGLAGAVQDVEVARDSTRSVTLALPSVRAAALERCEPSPTPDELTILLGSVVDAEGRPVPRATLRASWRYRPPAENPNAVQIQTQLMGASFEADDGGRFALCGFPLRQTVRIVAVSGDRSSEHVDAAVQRASQIATVQVKLAASGQAAAAAAPGAPPRELSAEDRWLATKGYARRAGYALLQQTRRQFTSLRRDSLRDVLAQVPRIEAVASLDGTVEYRLHASSAWSAQAGTPDFCVLDFYLNGSRVQPRMLVQAGSFGARARPAVAGAVTGGDDPLAFGTPPMTLDRWLDLRLVTAVEVFDAEDAPAGDGGCGGAMLWAHYLADQDDPDFAGRLRGSVAGLTEAQLEGGVPVTVQPGALRASLDRSGRFDFGAVTPARYQVEIAIPGRDAWETEVNVRAGGSVDLQIEVSTLPDTTRAQPVPPVP
jgi:hypothetical protein